MMCKKKCLLEETKIQFGFISMINLKQVRKKTELFAKKCGKKKARSGYKVKKSFFHFATQNINEDKDVDDPQLSEDRCYVFMSAY